MESKNLEAKGVEKVEVEVHTDEAINIQVSKLYKQELTRIVYSFVGRKNKKQTRIAPPGKIFLKVTVREGDAKNGYRDHFKSFPILINTPQDRIDEMAEHMFYQIKKQFSL